MGVVRYSGIPFIARFKWSTGEFMEKFLKSLEEKKLLASKCECGYTAFPPRKICPRCYKNMNIIEIDGKGEVISFTKVNFYLNGSGEFVWLDQPRTLAAIKLDNVNSTIFAEVSGEVVTGMKVEVDWENSKDFLRFRVIE